jgi:hypothetical protein
MRRGHVSNTWGFGTDLDHRGTYGLQARWYHWGFRHYDGLSELDPNSVIGSYWPPDSGGVATAATSNRPRTYVTEDQSGLDLTAALRTDRQRAK